ncbi:MAG: spore germination protein [Sphaerospermopsis sp. SIO1G2]|nr:spore germination protein [Sphaerospermopsis sp. SIO1G2]
MNEQHRTTNRNLSSGVIAAVSSAVIAVSGGVAWFTSQTPQTPSTPNNTSETIKQPKQPLTAQPGNEQTTKIYWLTLKDQNLELVPQSLPIAAAEPQLALETAFKTLLAGPTEGTNSTTIPQETQLLSLKVENDQVHLNLSAGFTKGGGSTSMMGRVGQVVYTATTLNPSAKVYIEVDGTPLEILGGEGVEIQQPLTRAIFDENYPL